MDLPHFFEKLLEADRKLDWIIEMVFVTVAAAFGAWLTWTILSAADVSLWMHLGVSLAAAIICGALMWLLGFVAKLFF